MIITVHFSLELCYHNLVEKIQENEIFQPQRKTSLGKQLNLQVTFILTLKGWFYHDIN